jgi:hypothetical protein
VDRSKREGGGQICIGVNRRLSAALTLLFGLGVVVGIARATSAHSWVGVLIASLVPGPFFVFYASRTLRRSPLIVVVDTNRRLSISVRDALACALDRWAVALTYLPEPFLVRDCLGISDRTVGSRLTVV